MGRLGAGTSPFDPVPRRALRAWGLVHAITATRLLLLTRRCATDRRALTRFPCTLSARLTTISEPVVDATLDVLEASADGMTFRARASSPPSPFSGPCRGSIEAGGELHRFTATLRGDAGDRLGAVLQLVRRRGAGSVRSRLAL